MNSHSIDKPPTTQQKISLRCAQARSRFVSKLYDILEVRLALNYHHISNPPPPLTIRTTDLQMRSAGARKDRVLIIKDRAIIEKEVLPVYYSHANYNSFSRQVAS